MPGQRNRPHCQSIEEQETSQKKKYGHYFCFHAACLRRENIHDHNNPQAHPFCSAPFRNGCTTSLYDRGSRATIQCPHSVIAVEQHSFLGILDFQEFKKGLLQYCGYLAFVSCTKHSTGYDNFLGATVNATTYVRANLSILSRERRKTTADELSN